MNSPIKYLRGNAKRLAMAAGTFLFFVTYSSFTFPGFVTDARDSMWGSGSDDIQDIVLADEVKIDLAETGLPDDGDVRPEGEESAETSYGVDIGPKYGADEILEYTQGSGTQAGRDGEPAEEFSRDDWRLVLINKQHSIPEDYEVSLGKINTLKGIMYCDERIIDDLLDMLQAAQEENIRLEICSPYRDTEYQEMLFDRKIRTYMNRGLSYIEAFQLSSQYVTVPGASEHQIGLALDIVTGSHRTLNAAFGETAAGIWLAENSYRYGFILRYPKGKEYITGIKYEPWHFRYVGVEAATVITEKGITLEEFWEDL